MTAPVKESTGKEKKSSFEQKEAVICVLHNFLMSSCYSTSGRFVIGLFHSTDCIEKDQFIANNFVAWSFLAGAFCT